MNNIFKRSLYLPVLILSTLFLMACDEANGKKPDDEPPKVVNPVSAKDAKILFLHHSVGANLQADYRQSSYRSNGTFKENLDKYNSDNTKNYSYKERLYPDVNFSGPKKERHNHAYDWDNKPFVYWDMWINPNNNNTKLDMNEINYMPQADTFRAIVDSADLVIFKHCFTESNIGPDTSSSNPNQNARALNVFKAQYNDLKAKMRNEPNTKFLVWTLPPQLSNNFYTNTQAERAKEFSNWVKDVWDEKGDNIYVFDFRTLAADSEYLFLPTNLASVKPNGNLDNHPNADFNYRAVLNFVQRTVDVLEGKGDSAPLTGLKKLGTN